ncbi:hypothetical protein D3C87_271980 [compost metagenome]
MRIKLLLLSILIANFAFAQLPNTLNVKIGDLDQLFFQDVSIFDRETKKSVALKDGMYTFKDDNQNADISIKHGLINGTVIVVKGDEKSEYKIENSQAKKLTVYTGGVLFIEGHRDIDKAYYREYYAGAEQRLKSEGWMSLNKNRHYGVGISKEYYEDGKIAHIANMVTETYTDFYPNGNKKRKQSPTLYETFNEDGTYDNRQYTKNNIRYDDYYYKGKLYTRSYKNKDALEIKEYYKNDVLQKREAKQANGQVRVYISDKL